MNHSNSRTTIIIVAIAIFAIFHGGTANGQPSNLDEVRKKITPSHEIWLEYEKLKASPTTASLRASNTARQANQPLLPSRIAEVRKKIAPSYEIWGKYETLKYETTPAGMAERAQREAEEKAAATERETRERRERLAAQTAERERRRITTEAEQKRKEATAAAEKAAKEAADKAEQERKLAETKTAAERAVQDTAKALQQLTGTGAGPAEWKRLYDTADKALKNAESAIQTFKEAGASPEEWQPMSTAVERGKQTLKTAEANAPVDLEAEHRASGISNFGSFVFYGSDTLQKRLRSAEDDIRNANAFAKREAQARVDVVWNEIDAKREEIARKTYIDPCTYTATNVQDYGNEARFVMNIRYVAYTARLDSRRTRISLPVSDVEVTGTKHNGFGSIDISVIGKTDSIRDLVEGTAKYKVIVRLTNLRCAQARADVIADPSADVLSVDIVPR